MAPQAKLDMVDQRAVAPRPPVEVDEAEIVQQAIFRLIDEAREMEVKVQKIVAREERKLVAVRKRIHDLEVTLRDYRMSMDHPEEYARRKALVEQIDALYGELHSETQKAPPPVMDRQRGKEEEGSEC